MNDVLKNSVALLQKLRNAHYDQLDACTQRELDDVLQQLCEASEESSEENWGEISYRLLDVMSKVVLILNGLDELVGRL